MPAMLSKKYYQIVSWVAAFAILISFFAPTISQAMVAKNGGNVIYQTICGQGGSKLLPVNIPSKQDTQPSHQQGHCAICCVGHQTPFINLSTLSASVDRPQQDTFISVIYLAPVPQARYLVSHSPQAPPVI